MSLSPGQGFEIANLRQLRTSRRLPLRLVVLQSAPSDQRNAAFVAKLDRVCGAQDQVPSIALVLDLNQSALPISDEARHIRIAHFVHQQWPVVIAVLIEPEVAGVCDVVLAHVLVRCITLQSGCLKLSRPVTYQYLDRRKGQVTYMYPSGVYIMIPCAFSPIG
jgi:hypothetical protein